MDNLHSVNEYAAEKLFLIKREHVYEKVGDRFLTDNGFIYIHTYI
jgi:hypothetical protein